MRKVKLKTSTMVEEIENKIEVATMVIEKIIKVEEKTIMMVEDKVTEEAKIKMGEGKAIFARGLIILSKIAIINVRDIHTIHMIPRIVGTNQEIKTMLKTKEKKVHYIEKDEKGGDVFYSCTSTQEEHNEVWYMDSGYKDHMIRNKKNFMKFNDKFSFNVKFGDDKARDIIGKSVISVQRKQGTTKFIHDVYYVLNLATNLLSNGQLLQKRIQCDF